MRARDLKKKRKKIPPPIPWLGGGAKSEGLFAGLAGIGGGPATFAVLIGAIGLAAGSILMWGPRIVDAVSGEAGQGARPGFWSAWYGRGRSNEVAPLSAGAQDSLGYLAEANPGAIAPIATGGEGGAAGAEDGGAGTDDPAGGGDGGDASPTGKEVSVTPQGDNNWGGGASGSGFGRLSSSLSGRGGRASLLSGAGKALRGRGGAAPDGKGRGRLSRPSHRRLAATRRGGGGRSRGKNNAIGQLKHASRFSRAGRTMNPVAARATESAAFEPGAGGMSAGGVGIGRGGVGAGTPESPPSTFNLSDTKAVPPAVGPTKNKTPYQDFLTMGRLLILLVDALLLSAAWASKKGNKAGAALMAKGAILLSLIVVGIGYGITRRYGQLNQGGILMLSGAAAGAVAGLALALGKWQPFLYALAGAASGLIAAVGLNLMSRI